jgi:hypothetical protein
MHSINPGDEAIQRNYPFSYWVHTHNTEIILVNLFIVILYVLFVFNRGTKSWQVMPEE